MSADAQPLEGTGPTTALGNLHPWMRRFTRLGFIARGILYSLIGLFTLWSIVRDGSKAHGGVKTTIDSIHAIGPGVVLLGGLAVGFLGFAIGMMWIAVFDWNFYGRHFIGLVRRIGLFIIGLSNLGLVATAALLIEGHQTEGHATRRWTELALGYPFGRQGVAIAGLSAIGYGVYCLVLVFTGRLDPLLDLSALPRFQARLLNWTGRFGMLSRGAIYVTIGIVLTLAAWHGDARKVVGFGGAMRAVSEHAYGVLSLVFISLGVLAYGCFMFTEARYRRIGEVTSSGRVGARAAPAR